MRTKLVVLMLSSAALVASAVPTPSSAQQFQEGGVSLAVGAKFTATSLETQTTTGVGTLDCSKVTLHMTVMANGTTTSRATSDSIDTEGCKVTKPSTTHPISITDATAEVHLAGTGKGTAGFTFVSDIPEGPIPCDWVTPPLLPP